MYTIGIDIGSTTIKIAVLDETKRHDESSGMKSGIVYSAYERHFANIKETMWQMMEKAYLALGDITLTPIITGSGGLTISKHLSIPFVQEVIATAAALRDLAPHTDVAIELGGEDAKIIYFEGGNVEQRMNGICAGGTGSFIDQMASLLQSDAEGLNIYAKDFNSLYAIAARCGVFAKSDIQPLINEGATKEDLSASIFQAVVNQTISGLACGKPIRGNVAFLGGPLYFLSELRTAFIRTLKLTKEQIVDTGLSHLYAAIGAAMYAATDTSTTPASTTMGELRDKLFAPIKLDFEVERSEPLFANDNEYNIFLRRHSKAKVKRSELESYHGNCYLGIDAGSTTTKLALIAEDGTLLSSFYANNDGNPLQAAITALKDIFRRLPADAHIVRSCATGYGEQLMKAAFLLDFGEVETIAHYYAAAFFNPDVESILDIGGQDMKYIVIKDQTVDNVLLNEACSSGCGSFIETFAKSLNTDIENFARDALFAEHPIDLGTRCTVFMNSKVKQAQKEGATVADISAGLAYSVIKNALFKVIKLTDAKDMGANIVVQGGTFHNNAVLRSFEKITGREAVRPDIAGIMGAFGAALIAREQYQNEAKPEASTMISRNKIETLNYKSDMANCKGCTNNCRLTISKFTGNRQYVSGNRCERGLGLDKNKDHIPNLFAYKMERLFAYEPLPLCEAPLGTVGIPRVLNIYENYPFWHTFFTTLGYRVVLSPVSNRQLYELGMESIPSESVCYPAKLVHGHVKWLIEKEVDFVFFPAIFYERNEFPDANNHYNCPIVVSYCENIKNNMEEFATGKSKLRKPFMSFAGLDTVVKSLAAEFPEIPARKLLAAARLAWDEQENARRDMELKGEETLHFMEENHLRGIVLAGRPYHIDPEIHHGIPEMITSYGLCVLTEDSLSHLGKYERPLLVSDQWMYHSRLYAAASFVKTRADLDLIQLNSFGCGLDAVTTDQVADILNERGKLFACLKIDEVNNLGSARVRIRSMLSAIRMREQRKDEQPLPQEAVEYPLFTPEMKSTHTILCPQMSPIHFELLETAFSASGYNFVVLTNDNKRSIDAGLKYVNNDACYPSMLVVGQIMDALLSGAYDTERTSVVMTQTGGGCRATNYVSFIRRALIKADLGHVPVIALNMSGLESSPGMKVNVRLLTRLSYAILFGDIFMRCVHRMRPYEVLTGSVNELHAQWLAKCQKFMRRKSLGLFSYLKFRRMSRQIIAAFDRIEINNQKKPRVGIVGEILVKYAPIANNFLVDLLEEEGAEAHVPDLIDFLLYCFYNQIYKAEYLGTSKMTAFKSWVTICVIEHVRGAARQAFLKSKHFTPPAKITEVAKAAKTIVSLGNQTGEGWFLTGEMVVLVKEGISNIVCTQPFACLPNHIVGKGVIKELRRIYPLANVVAIDYDPGASEVNQLNRIKLMLSTANMYLRREVHE
ncbi:MAG: 2-hydroxyacyl-CoA dehydratase [Lachnospiraceae bacterium]|jgi:predicted CoA-substrate-specific enzyme activase|nr:2-hydroxyacyl-CoA dehydratase [Lachnospiraceae bacterium]